MIGSEKITFSPVFIARCSLEDFFGRNAPFHHRGDLMIWHSESGGPGVTPPLTIDQRKQAFAPKPARFFHARVHIFAGAEHEQQFGRA